MVNFYSRMKEGGSGSEKEATQLNYLSTAVAKQHLGLEYKLIGITPNRKLSPEAILLLPSMTFLVSILAKSVGSFRLLTLPQCTLYGLL